MAASEKVTGPPDLIHYVIYDRPKEFPRNFVIRRFGIFKDREDPLIDREFFVIAPSLELARWWIRRTFPDLICLPRAPSDDSHVVESWI